MKLRRHCTYCGKLLTERDAAQKLPGARKFSCNPSCVKPHNQSSAPRDFRRPTIGRERHKIGAKAQET